MVERQVSGYRRVFVVGRRMPVIYVGGLGGRVT